MTRMLFAVLVLAAFAAAAKKPAAPRPPPPPVVEEADEPPLSEEEEAFFEDSLDPVVDPVVDPAPQPRTKKTTTTTAEARDSELTEEEAMAVGLGSICCCMFFLIGLVVLIVWLVKRGGGPPRAIQPMYPQQPPPVGFAAPQHAMQLSIFALAVEPQAREIVEQQLTQLGVGSVPTTPDTRGKLVREAARALLTVQPSWRQFGYGEKPGIPDLAGAEVAYRSASQDFRSRAVSVGATASADQGLVVVTLLICSRRALLGVSRLDDPLQVRNVLEDRMRVKDDELLGAELLWAPAAAGGRVSEAEIALRFPEMLPLPRMGN